MTPIFWMITVYSNSIIRVYCEGLTNHQDEPVECLFKVQVLGEPDAHTWTIHALNGSIIGTDVPIGMLGTGTYRCWIEDLFLGKSNVKPLIVPATNTEIDFSKLIV